MFRVTQTVVLSLDDEESKRTASVGTNDAIAISLPKDKTFLQGVEVLFKVPPKVAQWMDSVAWSLYNGIKPEPTEKRIDYRGQRTTVGTFGDLLSLAIKIPLKASNTIKQDAYSVYIDDIPDFLNEKIFIRLQLAMKGTPDNLVDSKFEVTVKPIYVNKGKLNIELIPPEAGEPKSFSMFIDGEAKEFEPSLLLSPGIHNISIVSDFYRNETRTVNIEQAKTAALDIKLRDIAPLVRVASPSAATVYMDGELLSSEKKQFKVSQGKHTFRFVIGDYEILKVLEAVNGKTYTVSVHIDSEITEEE